jgi:hypothetical protein
VYCRKNRSRQGGFTFVEFLAAAGAFGFIMTALLLTWSALATSAMNTLSYCQSENDQLRCFDYLRRDIRRATSVAIYNGATQVTGANNWGTTLQLTIPKYYSDSNPEDDATAGRTTIAPTLDSNGAVKYDTPLTVQYYVSGGVIIHNENGTTRTVSDAASIDSLNFCVDASGLIHCQISYTQVMRSGTSRTLKRQVEIVCGQHTTL